MKTYCLVCRKIQKNKDAKVIKTKNGRLQMRSHCSICENKKSRFVSSLGIKTLLSKIPGLNILF